MDGDKKDQFITPSQLSKIIKVHPHTISGWAEEGKIRCLKTKGGHRRYYREDFFPEEIKQQENSKRKICYARVSSRGQKEDLERQIQLFQSQFPNHQIIKDIGSGLNSKRKGFKTILDQAIKGNIQEIVVTHRDRLCRFNFELIEGIIKDYSNGRVVVLDRQETSPEGELVEDLLSIVTSFSGRLYGLRSHSIKKKIEEATNGDQRNQNSEDSSLPN
jgi:predicted site-specific integrase-resolvase